MSEKTKRQRLSFKEKYEIVKKDSESKCLERVHINLVRTA